MLPTTDEKGNAGANLPPEPVNWRDIATRLAHKLQNLHGDMLGARVCIEGRYISFKRIHSAQSCGYCQALSAFDSAVNREAQS